MTIGEFRAFLEGMDVQGAPTPEQWTRITEKLALVQVASPPLGGIPEWTPLPYVPNTCAAGPNGPNIRVTN